MSARFDYQIDTVATGILFGEGPTWCDDGTVVCTAVAGGCLHRIWPERRRAEVLASTNGGPNACAPAIDGGFLVTQNGGVDFSLHNLPGFDELPPCVKETPGIQYVSADGSVVTLARQVSDGSAMRAPNDLVTMPNGEVFFTDPGHHPLPPEPSGRVLRMALDGTVEVVAGGFEYCNGIALDHEGRLLVVEGPGLIVLDPDGSTTWLVDDLEGAGDGLAVDETGNAFVCSPITDRIRIVRPDGSITGSIDLPAHSFPTNCCFGGEDGRTLFVTLSIAKTVVAITGLPAPGVPVHPWPGRPPLG
jgi:gluconolactonase